MQHPFLPDLSGKSLEDLQETISGLTKKLTFAYRTSNRHLINQLNMVLEGYKNQYMKKMDEVFSKQNLGTHINVESDKKR